MAKNIKTINTTLGEVEEVLFEISDDIDVDYYDIPPTEGANIDEELIEVTGIRVVVPGLELSVREGVYMYYEPEEDTFTADFALTLIYEEDETDPAKYLYWEQDSMLISLYNFLRQADKIKIVSDLDEYECTIELEIPV